MGTIRRGWALVFRTQHGGDRRTINVGVQNPHFRPFCRQRQRQVYRSRRFTDATFAGTDGNNVLHAVHARLIFHALQGGDVVRKLPVDRLRPGDPQQISATLLF